MNEKEIMRVVRVVVTDEDGNRKELFEVQISKDIMIRMTRMAAEKMMKLLERTTYGGKE